MYSSVSARNSGLWGWKWRKRSHGWVKRSLCGVEQATQRVGSLTKQAPTTADRSRVGSFSSQPDLREQALKPQLIAFVSFGDFQESPPPPLSASLRPPREVRRAEAEAQRDRYLTKRGKKTKKKQLDLFFFKANTFSLVRV